MNLKENDIKNLLSLASEAGKEIMRVYETSFDVEHKEDASPITLADRASHDILSSGLKKLSPHIPVLSEEGRDIPLLERKKWNYFWLIDPLDGTKEFVSKNGEFTVNIALIKKDRPVFGLVSIPAKGTLYYASRSGGAYKIKNSGTSEQIESRKNISPPVVVTRSRSHSSLEEEKIISRLGKIKTIFAGSALKFCLVAEGRADVYLRSGPTMEWDTAAGHCVAREAGAHIKQLNGKDFCYNKKSLRNPGFICARENYIKLLSSR